MGTVFGGSQIVSFKEFEYFSTLETIGTNAFYNCNKLVTIYLPDSVRTISQRAFKNASSLSDIRLNEGLTTIGGTEVFQYCSSLKELDFPSTIRSIGTSCFQGTAIEVFEIPEGFETSGDSVFFATQGTKTIILPSTVTSLGNNTFRSSYATTIIVKAVQPPSLGSDSWLYTRVASIYVPDESIGAYQSAAVWSQKSSLFKPLSSYQE